MVWRIIMAKKKRVKKVRLPVPRAISRLFPDVKFVEESDKYVTVRVSKNDCNGAKEMDPTNCALARAVKKEFSADGVVIGMSTSYVINGKKAIRFETPMAVRQEIISFDRHHDFEPGEYYLKPASKSNKLGAENVKKQKDERTRHDNNVRTYHRTARVRQLPSGVDSE